MSTNLHEHVILLTDRHIIQECRRRRFPEDDMRKASDQLKTYLGSSEGKMLLTLVGTSRMLIVIACGDDEIFYLGSAGLQRSMGSSQSTPCTAFDAVNAACSYHGIKPTELWPLFDKARTKLARTAPPALINFVMESAPEASRTQVTRALASCSPDEQEIIRAMFVATQDIIPEVTEQLAHRFNILTKDIKRMKYTALAKMLKQISAK